MGCRVLLYSRKVVSRTGTREVIEVAMRFLVPRFNDNDFWEGLAKYPVLSGDTHTLHVLSISVGCPHPLQEEFPTSGLEA